MEDKLQQLIEWMEGNKRVMIDKSAPFGSRINIQAIPYLELLAKAKSLQAEQEPFGDTHLVKGGYVAPSSEEQPKEKKFKVIPKADSSAFDRVLARITPEEKEVYRKQIEEEYNLKDKWAVVRKVDILNTEAEAAEVISSYEDIFPNYYTIVKIIEP